MTHRPSLGVCYYPEHWPEERWAEDARQMAELGLRWVRVGEFAWNRVEPREGDYDFVWLHRAIDGLRAQGLAVVLGTPTATPPRWLVDKHPDMIPVGRDGQPRTFGSRRHYSHSHAGYRAECRRITEKFASEFGGKVQAWQTDNEYGCHDTVRSYGPHDLTAFRLWLSERYETIEALNDRWGNIFWSMTYDRFEQIALPNQTVTEANPAHWQDYYRFASDQVVSFNREQVDIIRAYSDAPISHNYMGRVLEFDHFSVGADLEIATWDSYPLGFLEDRIPATPEHKVAHARQGDPDFQALHHDLYRAVGSMSGKGARWWVMEQQPGPVNWAPVNPAPLPGMVRAWTWEAVAHGAEVVSYFRWRQLPFAQEQMHAGLLRPDGKPSAVWDEVAQVARELAEMDVATETADVAIVFDYQSCWAWEAQPQGEINGDAFSHFDVVMRYYRALRKLGLSFDILPPSTTDFGARRLVIIPALYAWTESLRGAVDAFGGHVWLGPRTGAKTEDFALSDALWPGVTRSHVETFRDTRPLLRGGAFECWMDHVETEHDVEEFTRDGAPAWVRDGKVHICCGLPDEALMTRWMTKICAKAEVETEALPASIRRRDLGGRRVYVNYGAQTVDLHGEPIAPAEVRLVHQPEMNADNAPPTL